MSLVKWAAVTSSEERRKRHEYYLRNREQIKRRQEAWRKANISKLRRYQKRYRRQVKAGARIPQRRASVGLSYVFLGPAPRQSAAADAEKANLNLMYESRV